MPSFYLCGKEHPPDRCKYATDGYRIPSEEAIPSMDDRDVLLCPGKTESGKDCRSKLIPLPDITPWWKKLLLPSAGVLIAAVLIWLIIIFLVDDKRSDPIIQVTPDTLTFSQATDGTAGGRIKISNQGKGKLLVEQIQASPQQFSFTPAEEKLEIEQGQSAALVVHFSPASAAIAEGKLTLHSNDPDSPTVVELVATPSSQHENPWWVYQQLETSSKILRTEP
ncbi:MAG: DUF1573 domain-containing protein [Candidatus Electrothrix sp. AX5]|nr:DUF1573 domain-containing protein [Candidatus Electrothrix sp. AX5]